MTDDQLVYVASGSWAKRRYHTDRDCDGLSGANRIAEKRLAVLGGHYALCKWCAGEASVNTNSTSISWDLLDGTPEEFGLSPLDGEGETP